jgi:hypothetical protein
VARQPKERMTGVQVRFPQALLADLEGFAAKDGRSLAGLLRRVCELYVRNRRLRESIHGTEPPDDFLDPPPPSKPEEGKS